MEKLRAEGVTVKYGEEVIIKDISLNLNEGELVCLLGTSGVGKTTLFHVLSGILVPARGDIYLNGAKITAEPGRISYMLQKDLLLPYKTVLDNVALPMLIQGKNKRGARKQAFMHFDEFGLEGTEGKYPNQLSGGMRQRAALLRTYLFSNEVALLDEPFSALDTITKSKMHMWYLNVMEKIRLSTLFITHDIDEAILLSDRIYILMGRPGKVVCELKINVPKPRKSEFLVSGEFIHYKKEILKVLEM